MKTIRITYLVKNLCLAILSTMIIFSFISCTTKVHFLNSSVVPAARGFIKYKKDKNKNYIIQVHVTELAEVERLQPPKQTYIVWMVSDQETTKNIGQMKSSSKNLSNKLTASFTTVSPTKPIKIFITAENDANTQLPGDPVMLSTGRF